MENKHTSYDLKQMQMLPLEAKIRMTKQRIRQWYDHWDGEVYVSFSGWTEQDIFEYIQKFNLTIPSVYGEIVETGNEVERIDGIHKKLTTTGCSRTGCMFCGFGCHLEKSPNRFETMKQTHPKVYDYCMRATEEGGLGMKEVIDWMNENGNLNIKY